MWVVRWFIFSVVRGGSVASFVWSFFTNCSYGVLMNFALAKDSFYSHLFNKLHPTVRNLGILDTRKGM